MYTHRLYVKVNIILEIIKKRIRKINKATRGMTLYLLILYLLFANTIMDPLSKLR